MVYQYKPQGGPSIFEMILAARGEHRKMERHKNEMALSKQLETRRQEMEQYKLIQAKQKIQSEQLSQAKEVEAMELQRNQKGAKSFYEKLLLAKKRPKAYKQYVSQLHSEAREGKYSDDTMNLLNALPTREEISQNPHLLNEAVEMAENSHLMLNETKFSNKLQEIADMNNTTPIALITDPEAMKLAKEEYFTEERKNRKASAIQLGVNVTTGTKGKAEQQIIKSRKVMGFIDEIKSTIGDPESLDFSEFLGYFPQAKFFSLSLMDKVSSKMAQSMPADTRDFYARMGRFKAAVDKFKSNEFKELIGAAQTPSEVKNVADAIPNMDMSSNQFKQSLTYLINEHSRATEVSEQVLKGGLIKKGTKQYTEAMGVALEQRKEQDMQASVNEAVSIIKRRNPNLKDEDISPAKILKYLYDNGHISRKEFKKRLGAL